MINILTIKNEYKTSIVLCLISVVMLFLALGYHPYSYYIILRWVVSGSSFYSGWVSSKLNRSNWSWAFFIIGILFNPIFPVYLDRSTWQIIDLISGVIIIFSIFHRNKNVV